MNGLDYSETTRGAYFNEGELRAANTGADRFIVLLKISRNFPLSMLFSLTRRDMIWLLLSLIVFLKAETHSKTTGREESLAFVSRNADHTIVVSCVGDSITKGSGASNVNVTAYPAVLQRLLGKRFRVHNFGVGGTTVLKKSSFPYWSTMAYQESLVIKPDIVIAMWGTNDVSYLGPTPTYVTDCKSDNSFISCPLHCDTYSYYCTA